MAILANDCFVTGDGLLTLEAAQAKIASQIVPVVGKETIPLSKAMNRVLAKPIIAGFSVPAYDNAAVDGYAVYADDLAGIDDNFPLTLPVTMRLAAGDKPHQALVRPSACQIFTGAPLPYDAHHHQPDMIYMREDCQRQGDFVSFKAPLAKGENIRRAGEDIAQGQMIFEIGTRLTPAHCGVLASLGLTRISVYKRLRVALASSGNEIITPPQPRLHGQIYDSNRPMLNGFLQGLGVVVDDYGIIPDRAEAVASCLEEAAQNHSLLITSGGMSQGEEDHIQRWLAKSAQSFHFWKLAIKPGRPLGMGLLNPLISPHQPCVFMGLPGNVVASFITFGLLGQPLVKLLSGEKVKPLPRYRVTSGFAMKKKYGRREFVRVNLQAEQGEWLAQRHPRQGSGILTSITSSDGLVELAESITQIQTGDKLDFLPMNTLWS